MTGRALAVQSGIAVLGLVTVYATWQREPEHAPGAVTVIDASKSDVTLIHYDDESSAVDLTRGKTGATRARRLAAPRHQAEGGDRSRIRRTRRRPPKPEAKPAPVPPPRDLPGAENAKQAVRTVRAAGVDARVRRARREQAQGAGPRQSEAQARGDREGRGAPLRHRAAGGADRGRGVPARHPRRARLPDAAQRSSASCRTPATWSTAACTRSSSPTSTASS